MASNSSTQTPIIQSKRTSFGQGSSANVSLLFEKTKANIRRSTPDSEALASSDDEQEQHHRLAQLASQQAQQPLRRTSWLSENHGSGHRKLSLSGSGSDSFSPPNSRGTSSNTDAGTWATSAAAAGRISAANSAFPWGNTIWNDAQKGPPARLAEVLPSSISRRPSSLTEDSLCSPSIRHDSVPEAAIPFAIPLHPTLKSYRSQSYSVGQLDQEPASGSSRQGQAGHSGRTRAGSSYAGLQHRLSRPSMLGDFSPDTSILEQLREVDDDDEISTTSSEAGARLPGTNARTMEQLAMENAILHQQAYANRASANGVVMTGVPYPAHSASLGRLNGPQAHFSESVLEEPDGSSTGANEGITGHNQNLYVRSISNTDEEVFDAHRSSSVMYAENRALQNVKKGHWQTSLGFGGMAEVPQSRRHSFAEVPLRNATVGIRAENPNKGLKESQERAYGEGLARPGHGDNTSYFSNPLTRPSDTYRPSSSSSSIQPGYNGSQHSHMTTVTRPSSQPSQQLYVVTFKAARAEFYYVQEGTGLEVNAGDLVIVEADRGTDLGTVAHKNIDWASAKHLKERYVTEHFNCLMMFSRQSQGGQLMASNSPTAGIASTRSFSGNVAGVGLPTQGFPPDTAGIEIKPKMIKRLAQPHEIHMLRDKEGNEAKAKRMCQQKVAEHHLNMEILDAEFQMDWKKLTFYYYAEAYVNFNSLVTDLFKMYKTRIWMSAINPASFVSPVASFPVTSGTPVNLPPRDRERYPESRSAQDERQLSMASFHDIGPEDCDAAWFNVRANPAAASLTRAGYAQYLQSQPHNFSRLGPRPEEFSRGLHSSIHPSPQIMFQQYNSPLAVRDIEHINTQYGDDAGDYVYREQLNKFQGLSLRP